MAEVRIIGGKLKGRRLKVAEVVGLRPSTDRNRETLFNWLQFKLADRAGLDLFAGTGVLGFEALSRGCQSMLFVEKHPKASRLIADNIEIFDVAGQCQLITGDAIAALPKLVGPFDLFFLDPPFDSPLLERVLDYFSQDSRLIANDALIYMEKNLHSQYQIPPTWELLKERRSGQVCYSLFHHHD